MAHRWIWRPAKGNTLVEYGMIGVIIVGAGIVVLGMFGSDLNAVFGGMKTQMQNKKANAADWNASQTAQAADANAAAISNQIGKALMNGAKNAATIEVTAANGSTLQGVIANITTGAVQIVQQALSADQIKALERNMSNSTFQIADLEQQMQDILAYAGDDPAKFMKTTLSYNGQNLPAITLAIGLQSEAQQLTTLQAQLDASNASAADKAKLAALVTKVSGEAAAIYSKSQALQSQYQAAVAKEQLAQASQALAAANSTSDANEKSQKQDQANQAIQTAQVAQSVADVSASAASSAAETAAAAGTSVNQDVAATVASTTASAAVMCKTGNGQVKPSECANP